jgi:hypothetical protein
MTDEIGALLAGGAFGCAIGYLFSAIGYLFS